MAANAPNAFDVDVDFDKVAKRREQYLAKKRAEQEAAEAALRPQVEEEVEVQQQETGRRPGFGVGFGLNYLRQGMRTDDDPDKPPEIVLYGGKHVTQWPYDEYHFVQQQYYVKLEELTAQERDGESKKQDEMTTRVQRPPDPPDIPSAVMGLPLSEFEQKAEERSIAIVSTWLFDCGLVDELLVHGGMGKSTMAASAGLSDQDNPSLEEGPSKMDKEVALLKESSQRTLTLINARLNDGVAASGGEVQELVNAVNSTKDDLGRLRQLSTYISNTGDVERTQKFMLTRYPKLKKAINARRNLAKCFRELDFYSEIPLKCEHLRNQISESEWSDEEWNDLREVSREHVELQIFLVEAEAGMKKRIDEEAQMNGSSNNESPNKRSSFIPSSVPHNYEEVDNYLHQHVKNVWELGDEIRLRIMSGIATAFDLAMNNPAGMVALVEAVEVYENANREYIMIHGEEAGQNQTLRFTDMRASAMKQLYQDFETKGLNVFQEVHDMAEQQHGDDDQAAGAHFNAVLRACNHLTSEIIFVQNQLSPCFPPYWALETLWSACVAMVCSTQILDQIGGTEGHKLPDLDASQLLDLVAWVENFRETIEESFPNIGDHTAKKTYFDKKPDLLQDSVVNMDVAKDSLAWANNMLWEVHDLAKDEFLFRTKEQTDEWLDNVYIAEHTKQQTSDGRLMTSLCEDVYSLAGVQLRTIRERLTRRSEALVQAVGVIFRNLYEKQIASRNSFLEDFETCCAAANDFVRMSEKCEEILSEMIAECRLSQTASDALDEQSAILLGLYSGDAVYAAQKVHIYIFEPIEEAIADELFGDEWLDELTNNELSLTLVRTLEDFMGDLEQFLDELMVGKTLDALVTSTVIFYTKCLIRKSTAHNNNKKSLWGDSNERALERIRGDIIVMREYFESLAMSYPSLNRSLENEFEILDTIHELMSIASGCSRSTERDFIIVLQKRIKNMALTKYLVGDLWHLVKPDGEKAVYELVDSLEEELIAVAPNDDKAVDACLARQAVPGLRLDQELAKLCEESRTQRSRPGMQRSASEQGEAMLNRFRSTWEGLGEEA